MRIFQLVCPVFTIFLMIRIVGHSPGNHLLFSCSGYLSTSTNRLKFCWSRPVIISRFVGLSTAYSLLNSRFSFRPLVTISSLFGQNNRSKMTITYPEVRRNENSIEEFHGIKVKDPYRWLEDLESKDTTEFIQQQNRLFHEYISKCPDRERISKRCVLHSCQNRYHAKGFKSDLLIHVFVVA